MQMQEGGEEGREIGRGEREGGRTIRPPGVEGGDEDGAGVLEVDGDAAEAEEEVVTRSGGYLRP